MSSFGKRLLGIDYGKKRIGLAVSDPLRITAQPLKTITLDEKTEPFTEIIAIIDEYDVEKIVIGLPLNMDGSEGFMVESIREFSTRLQEKHPIEIIEMDERLTSRQAGMALAAASQKGKKKKKKIDNVSAQIILQTYLDSNPS